MESGNHFSGGRLVALKVISLLSLVRWYNILLVVVAQYLASLFIINEPAEWKEVLLDKNLLLLAISSSFIIAAGYIINGFYDSEKDMINKPSVAMFNQFVSKPFRLYCFFGFNTLGVLIGSFITFEIFAFQAIFSVGLWLYSHKLKKTLFIGNISGTLLSIASIFSVCVYYHYITPFISLYIGFVFLIELTREIIKDIEARKGDLIMGYNTLPVEFGMQKTRYIVILLQLLTISIPFFLYWIKGFSAIMLYFLFSAVLISGSMVLLLRSVEKNTYTWVNRIYKFILITGILSIVLF